MTITPVCDHDARKKSYSLLADAFGLVNRAPPGAVMAANELATSHGNLRRQLRRSQLADAVASLA